MGPKSQAKTFLHRNFYLKNLNLYNGSRIFIINQSNPIEYIYTGIIAFQRINPSGILIRDTFSWHGAVCMLTDQALSLLIIISLLNDVCNSFLNLRVAYQYNCFFTKVSIMKLFSSSSLQQKNIKKMVMDCLSNYHIHTAYVIMIYVQNSKKEVICAYLISI